MSVSLSVCSDSQISLPLAERSSELREISQRAERNELGALQDGSPRRVFFLVMQRRAAFSLGQCLVDVWQQVVFDAADPALATKPGAKIAGVLFANGGWHALAQRGGSDGGWRTHGAASAGSALGRWQCPSAGTALRWFRPACHVTDSILHQFWRRTGDRRS